MDEEEKSDNILNDYEVSDEEEENNGNVYQTGELVKIVSQNISYLLNSMYI